MVDAKVDRGTNTITIDAEHVSTVKVFLNDLLVDLDSARRQMIEIVSGYASFIDERQSDTSARMKSRPSSL